MSWPFDQDQGLIVVFGGLLGPRASVALRLVLDTGAAITTLSPHHLAFAGYDPAGAPERVQLVTASGVESAPRLVVERLEALGHLRRNLAVVCHALPPRARVDGVLGLDFLRGHRLVVDFREGFVTLD